MHSVDVPTTKSSIASNNRMSATSGVRFSPGGNTDYIVPRRCCHRTTTQSSSHPPNARDTLPTHSKHVKHLKRINTAFLRPQATTAAVKARLFLQYIKPLIPTQFHTKPRATSFDHPKTPYKEAGATQSNTYAPTSLSPVNQFMPRQTTTINRHSRETPSREPPAPGPRARGRVINLGRRNGYVKLTCA